MGGRGAVVGYVLKTLLQACNSSALQSSAGPARMPYQFKGCKVFFNTLECLFMLYTSCKTLH